MSVAHFLGLKYPLLFVYYDTPFYAYQDKIISFSVLAYAALCFVASRDRSIVPIVLGVLALTVLGLASVNLSPALQDLLEPGHSMVPYWLQTGLFALLWVYVLICYRRGW